METKTCLDCGEQIRGRADKKFCSDQCRNNYNNKLNRSTNNYVRNINNILRKNRRILAEMNPTGKTTVKKEHLLSKGFNFRYITEIYVTRQKKTYHFCYEHGYIELENNYYALVIRN
jgi:predicted nucleic acid-binding Zn ribbon protein